MSSSGVYNSPSYKQEVEKRNYETFDDSSTRVFVFKEVSSLDEDESCNLGRRSSWSRKLGLVKKIKLSEDGIAVVTESFENFCEMHKSVRQTEERPKTSDMRMTPKPLHKTKTQPPAERGLKKQQRPTTVCKLSDIAVNKYPDSIFKVYIPEGNRIIKRKRVVPIADLKPVTPLRTGASSKGFVDSGKTRIDKNAVRVIVPPMKTKHSTPQALSNTDKRAEENSALVANQSPKKMTHITDISLTKEQEKKRIEERRAMRKRTMNAVKMAFPLQRVEERKASETGCHIEDSEMSGDENMNKTHSKSKSSLKSITSSCTQLTIKRSVTWGTNQWSDSPEQLPCGDSKQLIRKKKKVHKPSSSRNGRNDLNSTSRIKLVTCPKGHIKAANPNKREKKKTISRPIAPDELQPNVEPSDTEPLIKKKETYKKRTTVKCDYRFDDSDYPYDSDRKDESDADVRCVREKVSTKIKVKARNERRRCDYIRRDLNDKETESENEVQSECDQKINKIMEFKDGTIICRHDSFQRKRTAIIRKHSTDVKQTSQKDDFEENSGSLNEMDQEIKDDYYNEEETFLMKRGRSTPSLRKISNVDCSYGSSDSELCFRKDCAKIQSDKGPIAVYFHDKIEEKPLRKIFNNSNLKNEIYRTALGTKIIGTEEISVSLSLSELKIINLKNQPERSIEINGTFNESQSSMKTHKRSLENLDSKVEQKEYLTNDYCTQDVLRNNSTVNSKSGVSLNIQKREENVKEVNSRSSEELQSLFLPDHLNNDCAIENYYQVVSNNSSKSLTMEKSNSMPLVRETPMLNLSYDDRAAKSNEQQKLKENVESPTTKSLNNNFQNDQADQVHCQLELQSNDSQQELPNDHNQSSKGAPQIQNSGSNKNPDLKSMSNHPENTVSSRSKVNSSDSKKTVQRLQQKQPDSKNVSDKNIRNLENTIFPQSSKSIEDRKRHLKKMLKRGESVGASRMANKIMEKWNSTQKSITQRKEKMLASIRNTRVVEPNGILNRQSKFSMKHLTSDGHKTDQSSSSRKNASSVVERPITFMVPAVQPVAKIPSPGSANVDEENLFSEKEDFNNINAQSATILPHPHSSTNVIDPLETKLEESLTSYVCEDVPEKPLCESTGSGIMSQPFDNNLSLDSTTERRSAPAMISDVDDEVPERDISVPSPTETLKTAQTPPDVYINVRSSISDVDSTYGSTHSNGSNNESSISRVPSFSVEAVHSDENETELTIQTGIPLTQPTRNVQDIIISKKIKELPKSAIHSRPMSHERPASRRSKASSSGSSRRSVEPIGRPPSRKPHMLNTSDDDSDSEMITSSQNFSADCYNRNAREPIKKAPPSRMYSTLNHTPHSAQESIKSAIRDLDGVKDETQSTGLGSDRPMSSGQSSNRGGGHQGSTSRPSSSRPNMPKMSPGSVKILKEKSKNVSKSNNMTVNINASETISEGRNSKMSSWTRSTKRQESTTKDQKISRPSHVDSQTKRNKTDEKPPFRCFARNKNEEDIWNLQKFKNITINKTIENYIPPWDRVNLTPPENALRERALHEKTQSISSKVKGRISNPKNTETRSTTERNSLTKTPLGSATPGTCRTPSRSKTPAGSRIPVGNATSLGDRTLLGERTPLDDKTLLGDRTPIGNRTPVGYRTPKGSATPVGSRTPINCRTPINGSRTPTRNRTSIPVERKPMEQRTVPEKTLPKSDEKIIPLWK